MEVEIGWNVAQIHCTPGQLVRGQDCKHIQDSALAVRSSVYAGLHMSRGMLGAFGTAVVTCYVKLGKSAIIDQFRLDATWNSVDA